MANNDKRNTTTYPDDADGDALRRVASHTDMSKPMPIDFAVAVPDAQAGERVAHEVITRGYESSVEFDEESNRWTCYCRKTMLATYENVIRAQRELDELGSPFGAYSDGWGTFGNS